MSFHSSASPVTIRRRFPVWLLIAFLVACLLPHAPAQVLLSVNDTAITESNTGSIQLTFTLSLSEPAGGIVSVNYYTFGSSAADGMDFISTNGLAVFNPGETNFPVNVTILGDVLNEADETIWLFLTNAANALVIDDRGDGRILNDDPLPALAIGNAAVTEGDVGATNAILQVTLSAPSGQDVTAQFTTVSGTATAGADFAPQSGLLVLPAGTTGASISIVVLSDSVDEDTESFTVAITNVINAIPPGAAGTGSIVDDDPLPFLNIGDLTLLEGTGGSTPAVFPLTLSVASGRALTVDFQTINDVATGGSDFVATNGTLTFQPGVTNLSLVVQVVADSNIEGTENFNLRLSNPVNVALVRTQALATLLDDETRTISFTNNAPITAALSGAAEPYPTPIELSGLVGNVVKVTATLAGVTHSFPDDFDVLLVGPLGQTVMLMSDCGGGNSINNLTLTFDDTAATELADSSALSSGTFRPSDYVATDVFTGPAPGGPYGGALSVFNGLNPNGTWSLFAYDDSAGGAGALNGGWRLSITLSNLICCTGGNSDLSVTVSDSPDPVTATSNLTYTARIINNGPAGATGTTFTNLLPAGVNLLAATTTHGTLTTNASQILGNLGTIGVGVQATVTFVVSPTTFGMKTNRMTVQSDKVDPDLSNNTAVTPNTVSQLAPLLRIADATVAEGDWGSSNLLFAVTLSRTNTTPVTASFATVAGSATADADYLTTADAITFAPGVTNVLVAVPVLSDITVEGNETFIVQITGLTNALLADGTALGTINNDDGLALRVHSFAWSAIGATQYVGVPVPVTVTARDISNNVATAFTGPAKLSAITGTGPDVSIVISEIENTDATDSVEFANVAGSPVDISGWEVTFYHQSDWPAPAASFVVPVGTVCGANEVFTIRDTGGAPGSYPAFSLDNNLLWFSGDITNKIAVLLRDADGRVIDFVCAEEAYPNEISSPVFIPSSQWAGAPLTANTNTSLTYRRVGGGDTQQAGDFSVGLSDPGVMNPELTLPFTGTRALVTSPTMVPTFVNGVWTGSAIVWQTAANAALRASDVPGHQGVSGSFTVLPPADLALGISANAGAVATGQPVTFTLRATNVSQVTANSVSLTNTLPPGFSFVSASSSQGSFTALGNLVTFNLGTLAPGVTATASIQTTPGVGGNYTNLARIGGNAPEAVTSNNLAQVAIFVNTPPTLASLGTQFVNEGSTINVTNVATDPDVPANNLTFFLLSATLGGGLSSSGVFTWATTEANGPGTNLVTVKVQDNSTPNLSATQSFAVVVAEVNAAPVLLPIDTRFVLEGSSLTVTNFATDADLPANTLSFVLLNGPVGAALTANGVFTWTPAEHQGPATHFVTVKVQDNGSPSRSTTQTWSVVVSEYNSPPALFGVGNQFLNELTTLVITNVLSDPDIPTNTLTLALWSGPTNATLSPNGIFTWTPIESQGPGSNLVTIALSDNGSPSQSVTQSFVITVSEVNAAPTLVPVANQNVTPGQSLIVTNLATDPDLPTNSLAFALVSAPAGANLSANGVFTWTPSAGQAGTNLVTFRVTDNGVPALSATQSFQVFVTATNPPGLRIAGITRATGVASVQFSGPPGYTYVVESRPLAGGNWTKHGEVIVPPVNLAVLARDPMIGQQRFYRVRNLTLPYQSPAIISHSASNSFFNLTFRGESGRSYAVETRTSLNAGNWTALTNVTLAASNLPLTFSASGLEPGEFRVTRFALPTPIQRIERIDLVGSNVNLHLTLAPGLPATLESANNPGAALWSSLTNLPAFTNQTSVKVTDQLAAGSKFYRLNFSVPSAPVAATVQTQRVMRIWFDAASNQTYTVQYRDAVAFGTWQTLTTLPAYSTNSTRVVSDPAVTQPQRYYRLRTP